MSERCFFINVVTRCIAVLCSIFILILYAGIQASPVAAQSPAFIRVVHASPDVGTVDVFMDGQKLLSSFQYASVSNYLPLPPGPHNIEIALIGKGIDAPVVTQTLPISTGKAYTIAALGMQFDKSLSLGIFEDDNTIVGNSAKVRVYHLSPGAGSVDVTENMRKVAGGVAYAHASDYVSIPAGMYTFNVSVGEANTNIPISTQLNQWTVTSLFAIGLLNGDPRLKFVASQTTGTPAMPQTGGGPVVYNQGFWQPIVWCLALFMCLLIFTISRNRYCIKAWLKTKKR